MNPPTAEFEQLPDEARVTFLPLEAIWPKPQLDTSRERPKEDVASGYTRFRDGDILIPKITPTFQANRTVLAEGLVGGVGAGTTELHVVRPGPQIEPRYLLYAVSSQPFLQEGEASMKGVAGQKRIPDDVVRNMNIAMRPLAEQRAVADYLDGETARTDALVGARREMVRLVAERLDGRITNILDRPDWPVSPLKWKTRVTVGIVIRPLDLYVEAGVPCLRGFNVTAGSVNARDLAFISRASNVLNAKSMLGAGDVVVIRTGNAGAAAIVPQWAVGGNCVDLLIIRRSRDIDPRFLEAVLNSAVIRRQIDRGSVGALQAHFNTEALANLRVPVPPRERQAAALVALDAARSAADAMTSALTRQIELLLERRHALITSAVTGQLRIPGASA